MDLRNDEDDRPYRGVSRASYTPPGQTEDYYDDETMSMQAYYRERLRGVTEQRWFPLAAVTLGVIVFGSLIAFAYRQGADNSANSTTPLIQADNTDYKEKPTNPGGMDVPFQDAVVFDQLDKTQTAQNGADGSKIENLLPPPEQPIDNAPAPAAANEVAPPSAPQQQVDQGVVANTTPNSPEANTADDSVAARIAATEATLKAKTDTVEPAQTPVATATMPTTPQTTPAAPEPATKVTTKTPATKTAAAKAPSMDDVVKTTTTSTVAHATTPAKMNAVAPSAPTPAPKTTGGTAKVQLGAFKDEGAARAAWAKLQQQYTPHLNGVTPNYARADLGAKGVFYRVQGVNLSKTQAQDICKAINASKPGSCLLAQ